MPTGFGYIIPKIGGTIKLSMNGDKQNTRIYKHALIAASVTSLIWFRIDGQSVRQMLANSFAYLMLFLVVLVCTSRLSE